MRTTETRSVLLGYAPHGALADRPTLLAHDPPSPSAVIRLALSVSLYLSHFLRLSTLYRFPASLRHANLPSCTLWGTSPVSSSEFNRRPRRDPRDPVSCSFFGMIERPALFYALHYGHELLIISFHPPFPPWNLESENPRKFERESDPEIFRRES